MNIFFIFISLFVEKESDKSSFTSLSTKPQIDALELCFSQIIVLASNQIVEVISPKCLWCMGIEGTTPQYTYKTFVVVHSFINYAH